MLVRTGLDPLQVQCNLLPILRENIVKQNSLERGCSSTTLGSDKSNVIIKCYHLSHQGSKYKDSNTWIELELNPWIYS